MTFPANVYAAAVVVAGLTTLLTLPVWRKWCLRAGLVDEPGHRKIHALPIPLAGGLAVFTGLLVPVLLATVLLWRAHTTRQTEPIRFLPLLDPAATHLLAYGLGKRAIALGGILTGALGMLIVGWLDDLYELRPRTKFIGQLFFAVLVAVTGVRLTLFVPNLLFSYAVTVLWILTLINAFNFMDNMNGLCAGLGAIGAWYFALLAAAQGQYLVALMAFVTFGALLGFLPYNFPKARSFLGDAGSHLVGYLLAILAILPHFYTREHADSWRVLMPLLVLLVPLGDLVWVVILRWRRSQPFYVGDTNHLSHRLVRMGLSRTRAVLVIWLVAALAGALGLLMVAGW
jgi:UDP-GlcNAc:undecaprenyl-phosphate GlcNAc-1-phosphate transferase